MQQIEHMSNTELQDAAEVCYNDLSKASWEDPNSEWHEACFAAMLLFSDEMWKRGLKRKGVRVH